MTTEARFLEGVREALRKGEVECLSEGAWYKPRVVVCAVLGRRVVVKDFRRSPRWVRWSIGRWSAWHEARVLATLESIEGVPRLFGRLDGDGLVLEHVDGERLGACFPRRLPRAFFGRLEEIVAEVHAAGWAHGDLGNRRNVLRDERGHPWLVDFGAAVPLGFGRLWRRWMEEVDRWGLLKNKARFQAAALTPQEAQELLRRSRWRRLWVFGRRRRRPPRDRHHLVPTSGEEPGPPSS